MSKILRVIYVSVLEFFQMLQLILQGLIVFSSILTVQYHILAMLRSVALCTDRHRSFLTPQLGTTNSFLYLRH